MRKSKNQKNTKQKNEKQKNKKQTDENQIELDFTSKKSASSDISIQLVNVAKPVKMQCSNTSLSKKSTNSILKKDTCGFKQASGQLIENLINVEELAAIFG